MTNYEKYKELLDMYAVACLTWGVSWDGKISNCSSYYDRDCADCIFYIKGDCSEDRLEWLQQEYKEPEVEVDWTKVEVDTPILVRDSEYYDWVKRYFAGYMWGKVCAFDNENTSEDFNGITPWKYAKLAEEEEGNI